jgi:hypothetical protein
MGGIAIGEVNNDAVAIAPTLLGCKGIINEEEKDNSNKRVMGKRW